ncbi:hypothetical protein ScPMuIL_018387 [Solemya velum]
MPRSDRMTTQYMSPPSYQKVGSYYSHGPVSHQNGNFPSHSSGMNGKNFAFRKRFERVDWRKLASLDIDTIARTLDFTALQENIMNITFCNIEGELDLSMVDPNFIKLFKLAQLTIEYLLHSQDYLTTLVSSSEEKMKKEQEDHYETKKTIEKLKQELAEVKKESHKRKNLLMAQQQLIHAGSGSYNKCPFCPKGFLNNSFLQSHITRKHTDYNGKMSLANSGQAGLVNTRTDSHTFENRTVEPREKPKMTKSQLKQKREQQQIIQENQKEMEHMMSLYMKELKEEHLKHMAAEKQLVEMEQRFGKKRSNLGVLEDDENDRDLLTRQREEVAMIKEQLQEKLNNVEIAMEAKFKKQERKYQKKIQQVNKGHAEELKRMQNVLQETNQAIVESKGSKGQSSALRQQQDAVEQLLRESQEREQLIAEELNQQSVTKIEKMEPPKPIPRTPRSPKEKPVSPPVSTPRKSPTAVTNVMSMEPSDDEETELGTGTDSLGKGSLHSTMMSSRDGTLGTTQFLRNLRENPTLQVLREQLAEMLEENIQNMGIPKGSKGIGEDLLKSKLTMLKTRRQATIQRYQVFPGLRKKFNAEADQKAKEEMRKRKKSPRAGIMSGGGGTMQSVTSGGGSSERLSTQSPPRQPRSPKPRVVQSQPHKSTPRQGNQMRTAHSTGSSLDWTSTQWDSDDDDDESDDDGKAFQPVRSVMVSSSRVPPKGKPQTPSPRSRTAPNMVQRTTPKAQPVKNAPVVDDDWDDSDSDLDDIGKPVPGPRQINVGQPKGQKVSVLAKNVDLKLKGRNLGKQPVGGIDISGSRQGKRQAGGVDANSDSEWDVSPYEDEDFTKPKRSSVPPRSAGPSRSSHGDTDVSTNTYKSSIWGSSSKAASSVQAATRGSASRNSFVSVTDISSDEDLDLENI